jgi:hypothetical protein
LQGDGVAEIREDGRMLEHLPAKWYRLDHWNPNERSDMYKLIAILIAAMPIILFLRTVFFKQSKVMKEASSAFRRQVDYLVWTILFLVSCAILYSVGTLIHSIWK